MTQAPESSKTLPTAASGIVDSHAHLMQEYFKDSLEEVVQRSIDNKVVQLVNPAVIVENAEELLALCNRHANIYMALGQHPHEAKDWTEQSGLTLEKNLEHSKVVGVGECGLDFYYNHSEKDVQLKVFREQVKLAIKHAKPVIVHCRDAWQECLDLLLEENDSHLRGVFHCFTGGPELLPAIEKLDFYVSFSGILTYKTAREIQEAAVLVKKERMLVETDCPYLAPVPMRGKQNEPSYVWWTAQKLADLKGMTLEETAQVTSQNTRDLFNLPGVLR